MAMVLRNSVQVAQEIPSVLALSGNAFDFTAYFQNIF